MKLKHQRRWIAAMSGVALAALVAAPDSVAGTYDVPACGGGPNRSWSPSTVGDMSAYPGAPNCSEQGLVARNADRGPGTSVGGGAAARWRFDAPGGTAITGVAFNGSFTAQTGGWQAALSNGARVLSGCTPSSSPCGLTYNLYYDVPASGSIYTEAFCTSGSCPTDGIRAQVAMSSVSVRLTDNGAPSVGDLSGRAWSGDWIGGTTSATFDAADSSGVTAVRAEVDGKQVGYQSRACDVYLPRCADWPDASIDVNAREFADGQHKLSIVAVDRAGNAGGQTRTVGVDNTAPALPVGLNAGAGGAWRQGASIQLAWTNPPQEYAPIAGAIYRACPVGDASSCVVGSSESPTSAAITLPRPGAYDVKLWLRDAAGNATEQNAAAPVRIGWDADAPTDVAFAPIDPSAPATIRVVGKDAVSGIAGGRIEYRRKGGKAWRAVKAVPVEGGVAATFPDGRLGDGRYELRATVRDAAGNARTTSRRTNGRRAGVRLPLRIKAKLVAGRAKRVARRSGGSRVKRTIYASKPRVQVGRQARLGGRLVMPGGNPLAGVTIDVTARVDAPGTAFKPVAKLTTGRQGRFVYRLPAGVSRIVRFSYAGAAKIRPQLKVVRVRVPAVSTIRASRRRVVNGEAVGFSGRVTTSPLPATGKLVELQFFSRGRWRTFRTTHTGPAGRWKSNYRFTGTVGRQTYRLRVHMPRESGYTYAEGSSREVRVTVQGL